MLGRDRHGEIAAAPHSGLLALGDLARVQRPSKPSGFQRPTVCASSLITSTGQGNRGVWIIEPYSLRRTQAGDIVLHAFRPDNQPHRSYRVDHIRGARTTQRTFMPRYAVELIPTGLISTPPTSHPPRIATHRGAARSRTPGHSGPTYVYQFEHSKRDSALRAHKDKNGWPCSGRHGIWVDTKW